VYTIKTCGNAHAYCGECNPTAAEKTGNAIRHSHGDGGYGRLTHELAPVETAKPHDFIWAAGIIEGDGSFRKNGLRVTQKDRWLLERLKAKFGGSISNSHHDVSNWQLCGARARGLLMSVYEFLSPRRQAQAQRYGLIGLAKGGY